jgi:hypothetical protein
MIIFTWFMHFQLDCSSPKEENTMQFFLVAFSFFLFFLVPNLYSLMRFHGVEQLNPFFLPYIQQIF